jgi:nucleoside diphosphate kinase
MVLSRENAIEGWREAIGPVDPKLAKEKSPHSYENKFIFLSLYYFL